MLTSDWFAIVPGLALGLFLALAFRAGAGSYTDGAFTGAALGVPLWGVWHVIVQPLLEGRAPQWSPAGMLALFPALVGWVIAGVSIGFLLHGLLVVAGRWFRPAPAPAVTQAEPTRIVVLGGGFAGVTTAQYLEQHFGPDPSVAFTLVSETNALLFTPMLAEVAGSSLEPTHISHPLRNALKRTRVIRGRVTAIDLERRHLKLEDEAGQPARELPFDHLVLAVGASSNYLGMVGVQTYALDFKTLGDAVRIRNHVIDMFEQADREPDAARRRALLTFVVAGGGFSGVELAGSLNDFARGMLAYYPRINPDELTVILVHSRDRILPELSDPLAAYALERMAARGVTFKLNARLADARPGVVVLKPAEELHAETLVWTAGTAPNHLIQTLPVERSRRGAVIVEPTMAVAGFPGVWALGDCAEVPNTHDGKPSPPTAQFALREAKTLAYNIFAEIRGRPLKPFSFEALGVLAVIGHQTACAELTIPFSGGKTMRFSGLFAWLLWRGVYLSKLPGLERQVRVLSDWIIELFFPRDIVQTVDLGSPEARAAVPDMIPGPLAVAVPAQKEVSLQ